MSRIYLDQNQKDQDLSHNNIGDEGAIALSGAISGSQITVLDLSHNNIGDEGGITLANDLTESLEVLHLRDNRIPDKGIIALTRVLRIRLFVEMNLTFEKISFENVNFVEINLTF